jgi:NitT/TauT family transport system substrate-binding protein
MVSVSLMSMRVQPWRRVLAFFALAILVGCDAGPPPLLRVAAHPWPGYETLYLARSLGAYDPDRIRLVETASATQSSAALRDGLVEGAALTLDEVLTLLQDGIDLKVVLVMDESAGADRLLARPGITRIDDLRGRRVGVENGATGAVLLQAALDAAHLRPQDVHVVPLAVDAQADAWRAGSIDAVVSYAPVAQTIQALGANVLFDSSRIPGRIVDVLAVRADALPRHGNALKQLIAGHFAALGMLDREPVRAHARMAARLHVPASAVAPLFSGMHLPDVAQNHDFLDGPAPRLELTADTLASLMLCRNLLHAAPAIEGIALAEYLPPSP